jgi:hypothetical protein
MSTGLIANGDGSAAVQVGGTDYIEIAANGNISMPGDLTVAGTITSGAGAPYVMRVYTAGAVWTPTNVGLKNVKVTVVAGGGDGGPSTSSKAQNYGGGGGGGGGAVGYFTAADVGSSQTVTVGAATQTSSFGALISATGGATGANGSTGVGGVGGSGVALAKGYAISGENGNVGSEFSARNGGSGAFLMGAGGVAGAAANTVGGNAKGYGGGGGGAAGSSVRAGGAGTGGIVIVEEYY